MTNKEKAVRDTAAAFTAAIAEAEAAGLHVQWPNTVAGLDGIAISETGAGTVTATVNAPADTANKVVSKATSAATKAAVKEVDKAASKA